MILENNDTIGIIALSGECDREKVELSKKYFETLGYKVKLSKNIQNIAQDFANGYFFGELLYKYKLLPQFNQFQNNNEKFSITKNYILLQYKFDELKINFNDKDKTELLSKKKYKAEMILFQIRERIFSKLLQIDQITERIKNQKEE